MPFHQLQQLQYLHHGTTFVPIHDLSSGVSVGATGTAPRYSGDRAVGNMSKITLLIADLTSGLGKSSWNHTGYDTSPILNFLFISVASDSRFAASSEAVVTHSGNGKEY